MKNSWEKFFRVESYRKRGKGFVHRVIRLRDELVIHRLVKSKQKAIEVCQLMAPEEEQIVLREMEKVLLGK